MGMAVCKGWSHLSKPKQGVNCMDQSCSEDISPVSLLNHRKGITQGTTVYTHPLPTVARTCHNCHLLQEAITWGWKNLWCSLLSQNKINFTTLEVSFRSPVPLTRRYSEDDVQPTVICLTGRSQNREFSALLYARCSCIVVHTHFNMHPWQAEMTAVPAPDHVQWRIFISVN